MLQVAQVVRLLFFRAPVLIPRLRGRAVIQRRFPATVQGDDVCRARILQTGNDIGVPGGMNDAQVGALQHQRLRVEKGDERRLLRGGIALPRRIDAGIACRAALEKPAAAVFRIIKQQVDFMVAEYGLRPALRVQALVPDQHGQHVRPAIDQVAEEDEMPPLRVRAVVVITEMGEQRLQRVVLAVNVADDVELAVRQGLDAGHALRSGAIRTRDIDALIHTTFNKARQQRLQSFAFFERELRRIER